MSAREIDLENALTELKTLKAAFGATSLSRKREFDEKWDGRQEIESIQAAWRATTSPELEAFLDSLQLRLDDICAFYIRADNAERERVRSDASRDEVLLEAVHKHVGWCTRQMISEPSVEWLRSGLAAIAIHDNRVDYRDVYVALGELYLASIRGGIQPSPELHRIGALANPVSNPGCPEGSTMSFLQKFEESAHFRSAVYPLLDRR